ncbi:hypothetical protein MB02_14350 [Croceicoccus estronivorus]|uniref:flagella basal body P-ring formation protein FlgA n=1 Tax=Croceicoccus estronivorus TaxID=1172626 RepID=UPI000833AC4D|nr:flagella basal body P-ring formation protein FlgA [Croceicoccus estronivorus]OCC22943.1 hypothetical protein MB02_14350 [Croceicoccus estronivorus]
MRALILLAALGLSALPATLRGQETETNGDIQLADRRILVRDLALLSPEERETIGQLVAMRIPKGQTTIELSAGQRAVLLRRRVPGRDLRLLLGGSRRFAVRTAQIEGEDRRAGHECFVLRQNLDAGAYITQEVVAPATCGHGGSPRLPLRYDNAASAAMLTRPLPAGTNLGSLSVSPRSVVESGQLLTLTVTQGPVTIERQVHAMQPSREGRAVFVRTVDGKILAAPLQAFATEKTTR